jgi:5-aminopentanamidase
MRLAVTQFAPAFGDVRSNVHKIAELITTTEADVIVFPELATSGYFFRSTAEAAPHAMPSSHADLEALIHLASEGGKVVVIGFAESDGDRLYNSALIGGLNVASQVYRKTHLFYREIDVFTAGDTGFFVTDLPHMDCRLGTMICYDWRFPESARTLALRGADVIAAPSNLITEIWRTVMPTRAIENKVYLAVANRTGVEVNGDEMVSFNGSSAIYKYNGHVLASAHEADDAVLIADVDPASTRSKSFNSHNDIFADRRPDHYER